MSAWLVVGRTIWVVLWLQAMLLSLPGQAHAVDNAESVKLIRQYIDGMESFSADFSQTLYSRDQPVAEKSLGRMVFQRPGKFFWSYEMPYEQEIVSNGKFLWVYDKDLEQVTVRDVNEELKQTPILLLDEPERIDEVYDMVVNTMAEDLLEVELLPKQESAGFRRVMLIFENGVLSGMEIEDNFDQYNRISFHDVKKNPAIDAQQFQLHIPDGVDVIHATEQSD